MCHVMFYRVCNSHHKWNPREEAFWGRTLTSLAHSHSNKLQCWDLSGHLLLILYGQDHCKHLMERKQSIIELLCHFNTHNIDSVPDNFKRHGTSEEFWVVNSCGALEIVSSLPFILWFHLAGLFWPGTPQYLEHLLKLDHNIESKAWAYLPWGV